MRALAYGAGAAVFLIGITMALAVGDYYGPGYRARVLILVLTSGIGFIVSGLGARHPNRFHILALVVFLVSLGVALFVVRNRFVGCESTHLGPCDPALDWRGGVRLAILGVGTAVGALVTATGSLRSRRGGRG